MIGRTEERKLLQSLLQAEEPQFAAVYGRRRIGKTCLVRKSFEHRFTFQYTGISNLSFQSESRKRAQLEKFGESLTEAGYTCPERLSSWNAAFIREENRKISDFRRMTGTKYAIHSTLVTTCGAADNAYAGELQAVITAEDLFG